MLYSIGDKHPRCLGDYYVAHNATVIGSVVLGHDANVWFGSVLRGDNDVITVGDNVNIQDGSVLHVDEGFPLTLHRNVSIGHKVMLHGCTVMENSLIGIGAIVLNSAVIGPNSLVGANSLVPEGKEYPEGSLILGSPARVVRKLTDEDIAGLKRISEHYVEKSRLYRSSLRAWVPGD
ncbi:MAG: gamma carbonic anhydrase family protein [Ectothiorhodospiraceae bacterium]|nr:gamma carbonic anhydrase family protein [Chromatiales bacterium]MCP5155720.1 gamma carbonic anhydrase family protein [Ectothiorhodospiraceae bacterium]